MPMTPRANSLSSRRARQLRVPRPSRARAAAISRRANSSTLSRNSGSSSDKQWSARPRAPILSKGLRRRLSIRASGLAALHAVLAMQHMLARLAGGRSSSVATARYTRRLSSSWPSLLALAQPLPAGGAAGSRGSSRRRPTSRRRERSRPAEPGRSPPSGPASTSSASTSSSPTRRANPVVDLKPEDFEVFEDGKPQDVESFKLIQGRRDRPATTPARRDPQPLRRGVRGAADGRAAVRVLPRRLPRAARQRLCVKEPLTNFVRRSCAPQRHGRASCTRSRRSPT